MFDTLFYNPIYNLLALFLTVAPGIDTGIAILLVTLFVKTALFPLAKKAAHTTHIMKQLDGEVKKLKEKYKDNQQELGKKLLELYKEKKINPFAGIFILLLQIPIFFALYKVFSNGMEYSKEHLYPFLSFPEQINHIAFSIFDLTKASVFLGVVAGATFYLLAYLQMKSTPKIENPESFQEQLQEGMRKQMLYVLPVIVGLSAAYFPSAVALYWCFNNCFSIAQDVYIRKHLTHI